MEGVICVLPRPISSLFFKECVVVDRGELQKLGSAGASPLWDGATADPLKQAPFHRCYHVKFGSSASGVRINTMEPPKLGGAGVPLHWGASLPDP